VSSGQEKELEEILDMQDGPKKKFWLLAALEQVKGQGASLGARKQSCSQIAREFDLE
jgi:hypothetical protein